jgi:hypothetical protein
MVRRMARGVKSGENGYLTGVRDGARGVARVVVIPAPLYRAVDGASGDAYVLAHLGAVDAAIAAAEAMLVSIHHVPGGRRPNEPIR